MTDPQSLPRPFDLDGICDGCGEHAEAVRAWNAPQVAFGVCFCRPCADKQWDDLEPLGAERDDV